MDGAAHGTENALMIVVVEGPSAAGKTTWCRRHARHLVDEYSPAGDEPDPRDAVAQVMFWADVNSQRWQEAIRSERLHGTVVCDTDPVKLHYSWTLARIGRRAPARFAAEVEATRAAVARGLLGLADVHLVSIPSPAALQAQKQADQTRRRHSFAVHRLLAEPLREWYEALARLDPQRVVWQFPETGLAGIPDVPPRRDRSDPALLDAVLDALPALPA